jgi:Putative motility protein
MDVSALSSLSSQMSQQRTADSVSLLVLKKAMDLQQSAAMTLIASVTPAGNLPSHLGQNVNTTA